MFFSGMPSSTILNRLWIPRRKSTKLEKERESQNNKLSEQSVHKNILGFCLHFSQLFLQQYCNSKLFVLILLIGITIAFIASEAP